MAAIQNTRDAPVLAIEQDIACVHRPNTPAARIETNEDTTRGIQTMV